MTKKADWRDEPGLVSTNKYSRKFAYTPIKCSDGQTVWFSYCYKHIRTWTCGMPTTFEDQYYSHDDFIGYISEEEYIVRKLAETL